METFQYHELEAPADLRAEIECIWVMEGRGVATAAPPERIVPDGCMEIVFNYADRFRRLHETGGSELQPRRLVVGPSAAPMLIAPTGTVAIAGIRIRPGGAAALLRVPAIELRDRSEELAAVESRLPGELLERLADARSLSKRYRIVLAALRAACRKDAVDRRVEAACSSIRACRGAVPVDALAAAAGTSARSLERLFRRHVGMGPKLLARIARFQHVLRSTARGDLLGLRNAALDAGYFDQAHFLKDFRAFSGVAPSTFFGVEENRMSEAFTKGPGGFLQYEPGRRG